MRVVEDMDLVRKAREDGSGDIGIFKVGVASWQREEREFLIPFNDQCIVMSLSDNFLESFCHNFMSIVQIYSLHF